MKYSVVSLVGKPNVGKSTLFNKLVNSNLAIISPKPQTTRNQIYSKIKLDDNNECLFIDTPGYHKPRNKLDYFLNSEIKIAFRSANVVCFIFDISRDFDDEDLKILDDIQNYEIENRILIINKAEISTQPKIDKTVNEILSKWKFDNIIQISALHDINIDKLKEILIEYCDQEIDISQFKEPTDEFLVSEIIREKCIFNLRREIPYSVGIDIQKFDYNKVSNKLFIEANINIEKESQKPIVIGKGGSMIKKIGSEARIEILKLYDCSVDLRLFVKVNKDWRDSDYLIKDLGYIKK